MPSSQRSRSARGRVPLADEIAAVGPLKNRSKKRKTLTDDEAHTYVDSKSSRKILKIAQDLADDEEQAARENQGLSSTAFQIESRLSNVENEELDEEDEDPEAWGDEDNEVDGEPVSVCALGWSQN